MWCKTLGALLQQDTQTFSCKDVEQKLQLTFEHEKQTMCDKTECLQPGMLTRPDITKLRPNLRGRGRKVYRYGHVNDNVR